MQAFPAFIAHDPAPLAALADIRASLGGLLPEAVLTAGLVAVLLLSLGRQKIATQLASWLTAATLLAAVFALAAQPNAAPFFQQMLVTDAPARAGGVLAALAGLLVLSFEFRVSSSAVVHAKLKTQNSKLLLLTLVLGAFLLARTVHGIVLMLAIELISIPSYALVLTRRENPAAARAALNYLLLGAVATGALLYGLSLFYGLAGSLDFASVAFWQHLEQAPTAPVVLAVGLVLVGLLFKLGAAPLHFWAPDAYQAAPLPVALLLSTAPKMAAAVALWRFHEAAMGLLPAPAAHAVGLLFTGAAVLSLVVGTLGALSQPNVRRLLAFSSIAQAGFLLLAIRGAGAAGAGPVLLYAIFLLLANGAVFVGVSSFEFRVSSSPENLKLETQNSKLYYGLGRRYPVPAVALTIGLVALTGLPPTVGFSAKLLAFVALWQADTSVLGRVLLGAGVAATVASLFFYLRIPYWLFLKEAQPVESGELDAETVVKLPPVTGPGLVVLAVGLAIALLVAFIKADWLLRLLG